jgi:uncharacterized Zn-binding protein involved in type VI secretion
MSGVATVRNSGVEWDGEIIFSPARGVTVNGRDVAVEGSRIAMHALDEDHIHPVSTVRSFSKNIFINGKPVVREEDATSCGHRVINGSGNVFAN